MKPLLIVMIALFALTACNSSETSESSATEQNSTMSQFEEGKHYQTVAEAVTAEPEVRLFFSYNCIHCRKFDPEFVKMQSVLANTAPNLAVEHTHVDFVGQNGADMTWARSMGKLLQVEAQTSPLIFSAIHDDKRRLSRNDVRQIFLAVGIEENAFDAAANSFVVQGLQAQQLQQAKDAQLRSVPTVRVNGKYQIIHSSVDSPEQLAELVQHVAQLD